MRPYYRGHDLLLTAHFITLQYRPAIIHVLLEHVKVGGLDRRPLWRRWHLFDQNSVDDIERFVKTLLATPTKLLHKLLRHPLQPNPASRTTPQTNHAEPEFVDRRRTKEPTHPFRRQRLCVQQRVRRGLAHDDAKRRKEFWNLFSPQRISSHLAAAVAAEELFAVVRFHHAATATRHRNVAFELARCRVEAQHLGLTNSNFADTNTADSTSKPASWSGIIAIKHIVVTDFAVERPFKFANLRGDSNNLK